MKVYQKVKLGQRIPDKLATDFGSKLRNKGYKIQLIKGEKRILISLASFKTRTEAKAELSGQKKVTSDIQRR